MRDWIIWASGISVPVFLLRVDVPLLNAVAGFLLALLFLWLWLKGCIQQTAEYWDGKVPQWMLFVQGKPSGDRNLGNVGSNLAKWASGFFALVFGFIGAVAGTIGVVYPIVLLTTWGIGVYLLERYFKDNFERIKE